jgi:hypothetical protein
MELFISTVVAASLMGDIKEPPLPGLPQGPKLEFVTQTKEGDFKPPEDVGAPRGRVGGGTRQRDEMPIFRFYL